MLSPSDYRRYTGLTSHMLTTYESIFGFSFPDRTVDGLASELFAHVLLYVKHHTYQYQIADLEGANFKGDHNYDVFEFSPTLMPWLAIIIK